MCWSWPCRSSIHFQTSNISMKILFQGYSNLNPCNIVVKTVLNFYEDISFREKSLLSHFAIGHFCYRSAVMMKLPNTNISMSCCTADAFKIAEGILSLVSGPTNPIDLNMFPYGVERTAIKLMYCNPLQSQNLMDPSVSQFLFWKEM